MFFTKYTTKIILLEGYDMDKSLLISKVIKDSIEIKSAILQNAEIFSTIDKVTQEMVNAFRNDNKALFCGNGGSAADAQHLAAELTGRFYMDRKPLFAEALSVNTSYLTAVSNDYSYNEIFSRLVEAKGREGDVLIAISTSGNSINVIKAIESANAINMITVGLTGESGGQMQDKCRYIIKAPSNDTPRIQEAHIMLGHIICEIVEKELFNA